jgi:hypothetical protein
VLGIFKIGSHELFSRAGFKLRVDRITGVSHQHSVEKWFFGQYLPKAKNIPIYNPSILLLDLYAIEIGTYVHHTTHKNIQISHIHISPSLKTA